MTRFSGRLSCRDVNRSATRLFPNTARVLLSGAASFIFFLGSATMAEELAGTGSGDPRQGCPGMTMQASTQQGQPRAIRLIFEYDGDQVRLVSQQPVDMAI